MKALRLKLGVSQEEVADAIQVARSTYTRYELGKGLPDIYTLGRLADYFDKSLDEMVGRPARTKAAKQEKTHRTVRA